MNKYLARKIDILRRMDVDAAMSDVERDGFVPTDKEYAIAGMHKARVTMASHFTGDEIAESIKWLKDHGYEIPRP